MRTGTLAGRDDLELIRDYSFLVRFALLIGIWAFAAFEFKVFMDLSVLGLTLSILFFIANILVFVGFKTRVSMGLLATVLLVHGFTFPDRASKVCAILCFASLALPIGRYYSLDRFLARGEKPVPYQPSAEAQARPLHLVWKVAFVALAAFIIGGPVYNQILHHNTRYLIQWNMFHRIGRDFIVVRFTREHDGRPERVDYLKVLGHKFTAPGTHRNAMNKDMAIVGVDQLDKVVTRLCHAAPAPQELRLDAKIATLKRGWFPLYDASTPICTESGDAILKTFPTLFTGTPGLETQAGGDT